MSQELSTNPSRKKKLLVSALGVAALLVLTAGIIVGVNVSSGKTAELCAVATGAAERASAAAAKSWEEATRARSVADEAKGYEDRNGAAELLKSLDERTENLQKSEPGTVCTSRSEAEGMQVAAEDVTSKTAALTDATKKLSTDVTAFQVEAKRAAEEYAAKKAAEAKAKAAEETKAAEEAKAVEESAAAEAAAAAAAATAAAAVPPQYAGDYRLAAPQGPGHTTYVPAPAPYVPAPAPAPAPGGQGGGWTPPPAGSGGGGGCTQIGGHVMCSGG